ncbi:transglycosylase domain-containing protein [Actinoplanes sp. NPDC049548]|uniref:transglycosylase domain-containing protein n=1 Tax=Actinoplanes sp. NPDC049548 TaxID=3155152 RepID=UPI0034201316
MLVVLLYCGTGAAVAESYVESVPIPSTPATPQASTLYFRDGRTILARVGTVDHSDVPLSSVPPAVRTAVLAAEDRDFYDHPGVSVRGVLRAAVADVKGAREGASTVTQQYARNAFLTQDVSVERKAKEVALAIRLEREYSKDEILERYLNTIYFGRGAQGIAAAAHAYFGITPDRLTPAQGAVLAAVIKDPYRFDPANDPGAARKRWDWVVKAQRDLGWLAGSPAYPRVEPPSVKGPGPAGLIIDRVEAELAAHGVSSQELHTRGLSIVTTVDATAQRAAADRVAGHLAGQPPGLRAALVAVDPRTGGVRAYYGGKRGRGFFDDASAAHPAASTFKPIVLAAALHRGISARSRWDGSSPRTFPGRLGVPLRNQKNLQCPDCTLEKSMVESLNTPFYAVTEEIGADTVRDLAHALGVSKRYAGAPTLVDAKGDPRPGRTRPDIAIGRYPVTPADLATVYGTFASGGVRHERHFVERATDSHGRRLWTADPRGRTVLSPAVAADIGSVLAAVVEADRVRPGRPAAGKTGTQQWGNTKDNQDAWMAGYTPDLATAVWIGKAQPGPIRDSSGKPIQGDTVPAKLWRDFTRDALVATPVSPLPAAAHAGRTGVGDAGRTRPSGDPVKKKSGPKLLALTFDDGPSSFTPQVLDLLGEYRIKATFCVVGEEVQRFPELVRRIAAEGHALCNHSWKHDDLGAMPAAAARADIQRADDAIAAADPGVTVPYFRAPYGSWGASAGEGTRLGHTPLSWDVDPDDWLRPGARVIADRIEKQLRPGSVVLVHDGGGDREQTVAALRELLPRLKADGWRFRLPKRTVTARPLEARPQPSASPSPSASLSASPVVSGSAGP